MHDRPETSRRLFFVAVGDVFFSAGSRTLFRGMMLAMRRMGIDVQCRFYQFRIDGMPATGEDGQLKIKDFPDPVFSPTGEGLFRLLPRPLFRLFERILIAAHLRRWLGEIGSEDRLILHGSLGVLHLLPIRVPTRHCWWYKVGVIEEESVSGLRFRFRKWVESRNANRLGKRLVVSAPMGEFLREAYGDDPRGYFVMPCLVNAQQFKFDVPRREGCRSKMGLNDRLIMLYLGSAEAQQSPEQTIAFFKTMRERIEHAYFWVLSPEKEVFRRLIQEAGLPEGSWQVDSKPYEELGEWLPAADVGCLMRPHGLVNRVSSPVKFPEYMINGLSVVIGPEVGEYTDRVRRERVGVVVDPGDTETWGPAIEQLSALIEDREALRGRCFEVARQLSWQGNEQRIMDEFF